MGNLQVRQRWRHVLFGNNFRVYKWLANPKYDYGSDIGWAPENVAVDIVTGRVKWRRSIFLTGTVIRQLDATTYLSLRTANYRDYYRLRAPAQIAFERRRIADGHLIACWIFPDPKEEFVGFGQGPGNDAASLTRVTKLASVWILDFSDSEPHPRLALIPGHRRAQIVAPGKAVPSPHPPPRTGGR